MRKSKILFELRFMREKRREKEEFQDRLGTPKKS